MDDVVRMAERALPDRLFVDGELAENADDMARIGDRDRMVSKTNRRLVSAHGTLTLCQYTLSNDIPSRGGRRI